MINTQNLSPDLIKFYTYFKNKLDGSLQLKGIHRSLEFVSLNIV